MGGLPSQKDQLIEFLKIFPNLKTLTICDSNQSIDLAGCSWSLPKLESINILNTPFSLVERLTLEWVLDSHQTLRSITVDSSRKAPLEGITNNLKQDFSHRQLMPYKLFLFHAIVGQFQVQKDIFQLIMFTFIRTTESSSRFLVQI